MPNIVSLDAVRKLLPQGLSLSLVGIVATVLIGVVYAAIAQEQPLAGFPLAAVRGRSPRKSWLFHGRQLVVEALEKYSGPFQVMSGTGPKIVLPNRYADEIRNHPALNFNKAFAKDFFTNYSGFEPFQQGLHDDTLIQETVRVKLTQSLSLVTDDLVDETTASLHDIYGEYEQWQTIVLKDTILDLVARLSSRVFLGKDLCRNRRWLEIAKNYTVDAFVASFLLRLAPRLFRPIAYWFIPQCHSCRRAVRDAHKLIDPEVERRVTAVNKALEIGQKPQKTADAIGWLHEVSRGRKVDYVNAQLSLTLAAIHTTTETTCQALFDICEHPEVAQQLRDEVVQVIGEHGWAKTSLYKLQLMDSFLKEGQRYSPMATTSMSRYVEDEITLSDGTALPKGSRINVMADFMNPNVYPEPGKFDAARFMTMRQRAGNVNSWQFVTTSSEHMFFGHGQHACPGRFFASNEIKIALCHLLLKYDWRFVPAAGRPEPQIFETGIMVNPKGKVEYRRRKAEIDLDDLS
ncbi:cytochrome P450 [Xylariales sp. AK1849]|nr:cytochrome P450 [Xylariales sp. AK1849]